MGEKKLSFTPKNNTAESNCNKSLLASYFGTIQLEVDLSALKISIHYVGNNREIWYNMTVATKKRTRR